MLRPLEGTKLINDFTKKGECKLSFFVSIFTAMKNKRVVIRSLILLVAFILVYLFRHQEGWADLYAQRIYPYISFVLTSISNIFPFSIGEIFITISVLTLIIYPIVAIYKRKGWKMTLFNIFEKLSWIYIWFYAAWGINYSQKGILDRLDIEDSQVTREQFYTFAENYVDSLNASYGNISTIDFDTLDWRSDSMSELLMKNIVEGYKEISNPLGINRPIVDRPKVKMMTYYPINSMVGVSGSMAPFFCEFTVNPDVLPFDYPFTYTHEMAHLLGITSEAEANFYAYVVCTNSKIPLVRFSGYYSVLSYVLINARRTLDGEHYKLLISNIDPRIVELYNYESTYWAAKRYTPVAKVQNKAYDSYLKANNINDGVANYSGVVKLMIALENYQTRE